MTQFLLDTDTLSEAIRNPRGRVRRRIGQVGADTLCTSIIVAAELRFGAVKSGSGRLQSRVNDLLSSLHVAPFQQPADTIYAGLRAELERRGMPIGSNDLLIAAQALALGLTVVSGNEREFSRVPNLILENWLR